MNDDAILAWLEKSVSAVDRLIEIDRRSRVMLTFMTSHMKETAGPLGVEPLRYFQACYGDIPQEFLQAAENSFVTHHALRVLFVHWLEGIERLRAGSVGRGLAKLGASLPMLDRAVVPPGTPIVPFEYEGVRGALAAGQLPPPASSENAMMEASGCTFAGRDDRIFAALCMHSANDWAEEVVILWDVVRASIALGEESPSAGLADDYRRAVAALERGYQEWRDAHIESTRIHTRLFGSFSAGMFGFVGERFRTWTISPMLMRELYLEVAAAVARLEGRANALPEIPEARYWRRTPWTPTWFRPGGAGLPPF